jgi:tritrans,polycis-undecaprenyl-diphosphate synthase [geranylgeranyl-diphosphate specific]
VARYVISGPLDVTLRNILKSLGVYRLYEEWLCNQVRNGAIPQHIGIILDGNRRWALGKSVSRAMGHSVGAKTGEMFLEWCLGLEIKTLTAWVFSTENFRRSDKEVEEIFQILESEIDRLSEGPRLDQEHVRVKAIGRIGLLPERIKKHIQEIEARTEGYYEHYLNIAIAYGGREEIVDAVKKIAKDLEAKRISTDDISEDVFRRYLYTSHLPNPYPDLIIRTSGEERLSGFLPWQSAYSEFCFLDVYWPDFRRIDLLRAIRIYQGRKRRYGR